MALPVNLFTLPNTSYSSEVSPTGDAPTVNGRIAGGKFTTDPFPLYTVGIQAYPGVIARFNGTLTQLNVAGVPSLPSGHMIFGHIRFRYKTEYLASQPFTSGSWSTLGPAYRSGDSWWIGDLSTERYLGQVTGTTLSLQGSFELVPYSGAGTAGAVVAMEIELIATRTEGPPPPEPSAGSFVYEMERGFSFDGYYIPHFVELNWYFGDAPISYHGIQKVRLHGLTRGEVKLQVEMAGMQTEYDSDYMEPQWLDMPYREEFIQQSFIPATTYVDYSNRGLSIQMKYSGRNQNLMAPEPSHVIQVLVIQSSPVQSGFRAN